MIIKDAKVGTLSHDEEDFSLYFHEWIKRRRRELDLTQEELAKLACCSVFAIRKIEMGDRRPSRQLAGLLSKALEIPAEDQITFIKVARGELSVECLHSLNPVHTSQQPGNPGPISGNLPRELTPFIGREPELTALAQLLDDPQCSLLTIVGQGGIGKTRLAIEAAHLSEKFFPDGVWFVPLAALNSPVQILPAIASALEFKFQDPTNHQAQLLRYLRSKRALLVLDNAEHLLEGVDLFTEILQDCQQIKLLVTSRERLNLLSAWVFDLHGLPVPPNDQVDQFDMYSSVALFLQSARRVRAGFELQEAERRCVVRICQILEGLPLGIELAAAWVGLLPCAEIAREIERNLDFLTVSMRDLPERHRSLRATLDYSWNLLNAEEKQVLSRLAVFRGSFRREAAQEICGASLGILSSFRNKMLLYRTDQDFYSLHEIIRQYAELKLAEDPGEQERVKDRHASYFVRWLAEWEGAIKSARQIATFREMAQITGNLAQGWQRMVANFQPHSLQSDLFRPDLFHRALFSLSLFYEMRGRSWEAIALFKESVAYLKSIRGEFEGTGESACFNAVLGHLTAYLGLHHIHIVEYRKAREYLEEAIQLLENSHYRVEEAQAQVMLAALDYQQGRLQESVALHMLSKEVFREAGEHWWYLLSLINLGRTYVRLGKLAEVETIYHEAIKRLDLGDMRLVLPLRIEYAYACYLLNDHTRAEQLMQENLKLCYEFENNRLTALTYINLSQVALATHRVELTENYLQESVRLLVGMGKSVDLAIAFLYIGKCDMARMNLEAARAQFRQVIKIGHKLDTFYLVYWGLVNICRTYMIEGLPEKALEIARLIRRCPVKYKLAQDEGYALLADLQAALPDGKIEAAVERIEGELPADLARANVLAMALEFEYE